MICISMLFVMIRWSGVPRNKSDLMMRLQTKEVIFDRRPSYVGVMGIHYGHREQYP